MKKSNCSFGLLILAFLAILLAGGFTAIGHAQTKGAWVEYKLPGVRPVNWSQMVGENCLLFVDRDEPEIYAFDINSAAWHTYTATTNLKWNSQIKVGRNVALIYNDEMAVAYSGLTQEFVPITYSGTMLSNTTYSHDCKADMAYFATDQYFYVFDGEDTIWRSYNISDMGEVISWGIYGIEDYIFLYVSEADDFKKIVAFSYLTKTFTEYDGEGFIEHEELQHGFIFYKNMTPVADSITHFFAGYSAYLGDYVLLEKANSYAIWNSFARRGHPGTSALFADNYRIEDNHWRIDLFGFDTRHGNFVQTSYDYTYNCNDNCPYTTETGGEFAVATERIKATGVLNHRVYNGTTNSFSSFTSPLIYPTCSMSAIIAAGGIVYSSSDCSKVWFYDVENGSGVSAALPSTEGGYQNSLNHRMYDTWGIVNCKRSLQDVVYLYSYNQSSHTIQEVQVDCHTAYYKFDSTNVGGFYAPYKDGDKKLLMYSPGTDSWVTKNFGASDAGYARGIQRDFIYWYNFGESGPMNIFDGVTGEEISLPFGWSYTNTSHILAVSNFMLVHSTDDRYSGYSTYTRTSSEYSTPFMSAPNGRKDLAVMQKMIPGGGANILAYNVLYDNFVMTTFGPEYGTYFYTWVGGKTALIITVPGQLLAWAPYADAATDIEEKITDNNLPDKYSLSQNYPNPFNPSTVISYSLPKQSDVTISIINLLGQKIKTIKNENQPAGKYEINWDGTDQSGRSVASGIYFYQINSGDYTESKKMIMLK